MRLSIIIATYNSGPHLAQCLDSIAIQKGVHFELIVVDGKSVDNTMDIVATYKELCTVVISEPDNGVYDAWNKGIKNATGDWILFLGSDDKLYNQNVLANAAQALEKVNNTAPLAHAEIYVESWNYRLQRVGSDHVECKNPYDKFRKSPLPGVFFNRVFFDSQTFDSDFKIIADYKLLFVYYRNGGHSTFLNLADPLVVFRQGGLSTNRKYRVKLVKEHLRMYRSLKILPPLRFVFSMFNILLRRVLFIDMRRGLQCFAKPKVI